MPRRSCLFYELELNRIDDKRCLRTVFSPIPALARITSPGFPTSASKSPISWKIKIEKLFVEKSMTVLFSLESPLRRDDFASLRFTVDGEELDHRADACISCRKAIGDKRQGRGRGAGQDLRRRTSGSLRTHHQCARPRTRRFPTAGAASRISPMRAISSNRVERGRWWTRWWTAVQAAYPRLSPTAITALKAKWMGQEKLMPYWDRNAPLPVRCQPDRSPGARRKTIPCSTPMAISRPRMADIAAASLTRAGSTLRSVPARHRAPSPIRRCRRRIPSCFSTTRAARVM